MSRRTPRKLDRVVATLIAAAGLLAVLSGLALTIERLDLPPRSIASYLETRLSGRSSVAADVGRGFAAMLMSVDRGRGPWPVPATPLGATLSGQAWTSAQLVRGAGARLVRVGSTEAALLAIQAALPGDHIIFAPGGYRFVGSGIDVSRPGTRSDRVTLGADVAGTVVLDLDMAEGFMVSAPHWTFENLTIRGACKLQADCEHAFHVIGGANNFIARNNTVIDFNAHFKINGFERKFPDHGLIERNTITNGSVRRTDTPVAPIDLVAASHWVVRHNVITDFVKGQSNRISYGAFAKGGGANNRFERNLVICEHRLRGFPGQRIGISLGGGGTGKDYCRDQRCDTEQEAGIVESNLVASCSDDGIYVNRAAMSKLVHNTLIDTGGISVRFPESAASVDGNLVDGIIRSRDGAALHDDDNLQTAAMNLFVGSHPMRRLFVDAAAFDFSWAAVPPRRTTASPGSADLCGADRPGRAAYGAFENFAACAALVKLP